jgi:Trypsin-co-occurring domain 1
MADVVEFELADGSTVAVAAAPRAGTGTVGLGERMRAAGETLREALAPVVTAASEVTDGFREMSRRPDEVEITFGVTLDGKFGGVITSAGLGAHLEVKLRWTTPATSGSAPAADAAP